MGLDSSSDSLRRRVSREPYACQGFRSQLSLPQHCYGKLNSSFVPDLQLTAAPSKVVNTYGISVGIAKIGWKLYIVYIVWICVEIVTIYFLFVETAGKTLEELKEIFEAKNPRKASTMKVKIEVDNSGNVLHVDAPVGA